MSGVFGGVRRDCRIGVLVLGLVLFVGAVPVLAQLPTGTILGTVKDASGALVPGATVTAQNVETGTVRSILTDETGAYRLAASWRASSQPRRRDLFSMSARKRS